MLCARITYVGELGMSCSSPGDDRPCVRDAVGSGRRSRLAARGSEGAVVAAPGEGLPRLRPRHRQHRLSAAGRSRLRPGAGQAGGFLGRDAVLARKATAEAAGGFTARLVQIRLLDPEPLLYHAEIVYRDDVAVGYVRAASYGWTLGGAVGLAYVEADVPVTPAWLADGTWEVDVAGVRHPAAVSLRPMYDPTNARVKG